MQWRLFNRSSREQVWSPKREGEKSENGEGNLSAVTEEAEEGMVVSFLGEKWAIGKWMSER